MPNLSNHSKQAILPTRRRILPKKGAPIRKHKTLHSGSTREAACA
jgi:hypothetical protein